MAANFDYSEQCQFRNERSFKDHVKFLVKKFQYLDKCSATRPLWPSQIYFFSRRSFKFNIKSNLMQSKYKICPILYPIYRYNTKKSTHFDTFFPQSIGPVLKLLTPFMESSGRSPISSNLYFTNEIFIFNHCK